MTERTQSRPSVEVDAGGPYLTVAEVAAMIGVSERWLGDQCRDEAIEHVHIARKRRFTPAQVEKLMKKHTIRPAVRRQQDAQHDRVVRMLQSRDARQVAGR